MKLTKPQLAALRRVELALVAVGGTIMRPRPGEGVALRKLGALGLIEVNYPSNWSGVAPSNCVLTDAGRAALKEADAIG